MKTAAFISVVGLTLWGAEQPTRMADLKNMSLEALLDVTAVSAARREQRQIDTVRSMSVLTAEDLRRRNYRTIPEALNELVGVMLQRTNYGGGAPIIRGMIGNRVLILVDGLRLNNAIYRLGPNQYLNTIDIAEVERIEVIRGPGSVLYGGDAMGGLINIVTRQPLIPNGTSEFLVRSFARFSTADRGVSSRLDFSGGRGKLGVTGGLSGKRFNDLDAGRGRGRQRFTGYDELDGNLKLAYKVSPNGRVTLGVERVHQDGVDRTDLLTAGSDLKYEWSPQQRDLAFARYTLDRPGSFVESLELAAAYTNHLEQFERVASAKPGVLRKHHDQVRSAGLVAQARSVWGGRQMFTYGVEFYGDNITSRRTDIDQATGVSVPAPSTFADGAHYRSLALFLQDEIQLAERLAVNLGLRASRFSLKALTENAGTGALPLESAVRTVTGSAYGSYKLRANLRAIFGVAQGFRAPNVDDGTTLGSFGGGFEVPNPFLSPERSVNYETGLKVQSKRFSGTASGFVAHYRDLIERQPGSFNGQPFLDLNGDGIRDRGEDAVFQRQNAGRARVLGYSFEGQLQLRKPWTLFGNAAWTRGDDTGRRTPLTRIPPVKGIAGCRWTPRGNAWIEAYSMFAGRQNRLSPNDLSDRRINPAGTPGFATLNLRGGVDLGRLGVLTLGLENVTNKLYRWHGSGIDSPGRNFVIGFGRVFR